MWLYHWAAEQRPVWILLGLAISGLAVKIYGEGGEQQKFMELWKSTSVKVVEPFSLGAVKTAMAGGHTSVFCIVAPGKITEHTNTNTALKQKRSVSESPALKMR